MNKHESLKKQWDEEEANIKFCKSYMDDYKAEWDEALDEKAQADELAAYWLNRANENIDAANAVLDQLDELTEEQQDQVDELLDWVDELLLMAEEFLDMADEQAQIAAAAQRKAWNAKQKYENEEDELDKWIKLKLLTEYELQEIEPCLRYPCLEDEVEAIAGSGLHYDLD